MSGIVHCVTRLMPAAKYGMRRCDDYASTAHSEFERLGICKISANRARAKSFELIDFGESASHGAYLLTGCEQRTHNLAAECACGTDDKNHPVIRRT
jgi:hypothetical protein